MKESMKTLATASAWQRETIYSGEKERADTDLEHFSWFSVALLTCLSAPSNWALWTFVTLNLRVQLSIFTSSNLANNCPKTRFVLSLPPVVSIGQTSASLGSAHAYQIFFVGLQPSLVIFNYNKSLDLAIRRLFAFSFIFLFIHSISIFFEPFNYIITSRICLLELAAFFCNCRQVFSLYALSTSMWCIYIVGCRGPPCLCSQNRIHLDLSKSKRMHLHTKRWVSETSRQVDIPRKQHLIYRKWHQYAASESMIVIDKLSVIWRSGLSNKIKRIFPDRRMIPNCIS